MTSPPHGDDVVTNHIHCDTQSAETYYIRPAVQWRCAFSKRSLLQQKCSTSFLKGGLKLDKANEGKGQLQD